MEKEKTKLPLPEKGFLRINQVLQYIPVGRSTWWEGVRSGKFPPAIKLSANVTVWKCSDIHNLIDSY